DEPGAITVGCGALPRGDDKGVPTVPETGIVAVSEGHVEAGGGLHERARAAVGPILAVRGRDRDPDVSGGSVGHTDDPIARSVVVDAWIGATEVATVRAWIIGRPPCATGVRGERAGWVKVLEHQHALVGRNEEMAVTGRDGAIGWERVMGKDVDGAA